MYMINREVTALRIIDVFPNWLTDGVILNKIHALNKPLPWDNDPNIDNLLLDYDYIANSGDKLIAPIVEKLLTDNKLTPDNLTKLATMIYQKNIKNWTGLYKTITTEYNPIENYRMVETEQTDTTNQTNQTDTTQQTTELSGESSQTDTQTQTDTSNKTNTEQHEGFNSSDWDDVRKTTDTQTDESNATNTQTDTQTQTTTDNKTTTNQTNMNQNDTRTLTRSGNIGVTTTQQMLQSERELWQYNYFKNVFDDINQTITLCIY